MHKSRLAGLIIDCEVDDLEGAAEFWSAALGYPVRRSEDPAESEYNEMAPTLNRPARLLL